jgi:transcription elongation factor Elf1
MVCRGGVVPNVGVHIDHDLLDSKGKTIGSSSSSSFSPPQSPNVNNKNDIDGEDARHVARLLLELCCACEANMLPKSESEPSSMPNSPIPTPTPPSTTPATPILMGTNGVDVNVPTLPSMTPSLFASRTNSSISSIPFPLSDSMITCMLNSATFRQYPPRLTSLLSVLLVRPAGARYRSPLPWPGLPRALRQLATRGLCMSCNHEHRTSNTRRSQTNPSAAASTSTPIPVTSNGTTTTPAPPPTAPSPPTASTGASTPCGRCARPTRLGSCVSCGHQLCESCDTGYDTQFNASSPSKGATITCALCLQLDTMKEWMVGHAIEVATVSSV